VGTGTLRRLDGAISPSNSVGEELRLISVVDFAEESL